MSHFILADCNNFYVSCERLFNPKLEEMAVIVLSNNDGCVVARSQEAKKIGIKMGQPYFQIKALCSQYQVAVYSSNYLLYGDISERVMNILTNETFEIEVYSIDEAFLKYPDSFTADTLTEESLKLRKKIKKWLGLPVSFGIASTKTLAKIANDLAKKTPSGIFNLSSPELQKKILQEYPVGDVWGIGPRLSKQLKAMGIYTAWAFKEMDPLRIRNIMGVVGERMLWELRGVSCLPLEVPSPKKSITTSRSFETVITKEEELAEALSTFASAACTKLREQGSYATAVCIFLEAFLDRQAGTRRAYQSAQSFAFPTCDTSHVISACKSLLSALFIQGEQYKKCGVILLDLIPETCVIPDLFLGNIDPKRQDLLATLDALNARFGKRTVFFGATGVTPKWKMRSDKRSAHNTVEWKALPVVKA